MASSELQPQKEEDGCQVLELLDTVLNHLNRIERSLDVQVLDGLDVIHTNIPSGGAINKPDLKLLLENMVKSPIRINLSRLRGLKKSVDEAMRLIRKTNNDRVQSII